MPPKMVLHALFNREMSFKTYSSKISGAKLDDHCDGIQFLGGE